mmetsp:Transcript_89949/g.279974  ORF Transcript_89949/g.279974 Transcript_89949/m.279974 type:complete len:276 (-) Transcript_89949:1294-2121(-)
MELLNSVGQSIQGGGGLPDKRKILRTSRLLLCHSGASLRTLGPRHGCLSHFERLLRRLLCEKHPPPQHLRCIAFMPRQHLGRRVLRALRSAVVLAAAGLAGLGLGHLRLTPFQRLVRGGENLQVVVGLRLLGVLCVAFLGGQSVIHHLLQKRLLVRVKQADQCLTVKRVVGHAETLKLLVRELLCVRVHESVQQIHQVLEVLLLQPPRGVLPHEDVLEVLFHNLLGQRWQCMGRSVEITAYEAAEGHEWDQRLGHRDLHLLGKVKVREPCPVVDP